MATEQKDLRHVVDLTGRYLMNTYNRLPVELVRGEGARAWDSDGNEYLDFVAGLAVNGLGHGHPRVVAAIKEAADYILHTSNLYHIGPQARLAQKLSRLSGFERVFFGNSGAEANEGAIKLARRYGQRDGGGRFKIVSALHSFHGRTLGALTATGQPKYHEGFGPLPGGFQYVPLNDIEALKAAVDGETAAVLLEPIQGESGVRPCTPEYLAAVRALCDERGALLIFDEIQTGMGRTGKMFAFEHFGVRPDIMTLAKALGGGIPIGALLATEKVADAFEPGVHATTFGGNPFACRVASAVVDVMTADDLPGAAKRAGARLRAGLEAVGEATGSVKEVRGLGLMLGVELEGVAAPKVMAECRERGLLVNAIGDAVLRLLPPLVVTEADVDEAVDIIGQSLRAAADAV